MRQMFPRTKQYCQGSARVLIRTRNLSHRTGYFLFLPICAKPILSAKNAGRMGPAKAARKWGPERTMRRSETTVTKEEIIAAVKKCAAELGHAPSVAEFHQITKISKTQVRRHFGSHTGMLAAGGVERFGSGFLLTLETLFVDWARTVRSLKKIPTMAEYEM